LLVSIRVLLTSVSGALFKHLKLRNYSLKKSISSISDALNTQIFIKNYYLKLLTSVPGTLVNISLNIM